MATKSYTDRSNCIRAARVALGQHAHLGDDFTVQGEKGAYSWAPVAKKLDQASAAQDQAAQASQAYQGARQGRGAGMARLLAAPQAEALRLQALAEQQAALAGVRKDAPVAVVAEAAALPKARKPKAAPAEAAAPAIGALVPAWAPAVARGEHKPGTQGALLVTLMGRPEGWTDVELSEHLGKKHAISAAFQACARVGVAIYKRREGRTVRYFTTLPAADAVAQAA